MSNLLRQKALESGLESRVQVNQRMLIDKMLARYSSDFVVCRELMQNADDAQASSFHFEITCHGTYSTEKDFHLKTIDEIRAVNNGLVFSETDWKRVAAIAEGNTNVESVGQFGVGFFSVFSFSEEPIITSGKDYMAFVWRDDHSLTTYRHQLPEDQQTSLTSIILKMRPDYVLNTETDVDIDLVEDDNQKSSNKKKKKNRTVVEEATVPMIHLNQLKAFFTKVLSFTKYLNELMITINHVPIFKVTKSKRISNSKKFQFKKNSIHNMLKMNSFVEAEQIFAIDNGPSITLKHISVDANLIIDEQYHQQIRRILKKSLPPNIQIQLLYAPNNIPLSQARKSGERKENIYRKILQSLIPMRSNQAAGLIFIGLGTHQTTGMAVHVYSHLIPTIERENLDLQDPYISKWNRELLLCVGEILRSIYEQSLNHRTDYSSIFTLFSFQTSVPNEQIGLIILDGFFSSNKDILIPVKRSPEDKQFSLIPSNQAYFTSEKYLHAFLSLPLVPEDLRDNGFFQALRERDLILELTDELIESNITTSILLSDQFVALLNWLSNSHRNDKAYIKRILSIVRFRENDHSPIITLEKLKSYDQFHIPAMIPLPSNVLPSSIASHLSREQLEKQLNLSALSLHDFLHFYLLKSQMTLFTQEKTSSHLLSILSKHSGQIKKTEWVKLKATLASVPCIPTSAGMKVPHESYIPSSIVSSDVPLITLSIPSTESDIEPDGSVSEEFLKHLGCRTVNVQSFVQFSSSSHDSEQSHNMRLFIEQLMEERQSMSEGDFNALKRSECLQGTTLALTKANQRKYAPEQLHFRWLAEKLQWKNLLILDWTDLERNSREYTFLKSLGVREVPDVNQLIDRIVDEYNQQANLFDIPLSLHFFAEHFQQDYSKAWKTLKVKRPFLPCQLPDRTQVLSLPDEVFKVSNPLCGTLLTQVVDLFEEHFNLSLLGIKDRPTLAVAFDILMSKKEKILNVNSAREIFAFMNDLDGLSRPFIERVSKLSFIPLEGSDEFFRPSQVFLRPSSSKGTTHTINVQLLPSDDDDEENFSQGGRRRQGKRSSKLGGSATTKKSKMVTVSPSLISDDIDQTGLIDYVDFGPDANSFLLSLGVTHQPSSKVLAELLIDRQANYFVHTRPDELKRKLLAYTSCLRQLARSIDELDGVSLVKRLKNERWCLGYQMTEDGCQRLFRIVSPKEIYLDDDHQCALDLRPLLPPDEPELTKLYEKFGATWLSECVKRTLVHKGKVATSDRGNKLRHLIQYRLDMLFVNNRGEKLDNVDEKHLNMLRNHLSVYEVDSIQCQLTFEKQTIVLDSCNSSSCALEHDKNDVYLYFQKNIHEFDYIDIASELARFVFKKPLDTIVHAISDKLASPLETLKRRGVPVDRLLKQQQSTLISSESVKNVVNTPMETNSTSHMEMIGRVEDFSRVLSKDDKKLFSSLKKGRSFTQNKFTQQEHLKDEIDHSCEAVPAANMTRYKDRFHSMPLYVEHGVRITDSMLDQAKQLAWLLNGLAKYVFEIPVETLHLYRDIDGARLAFNDRRALFFNLRYYEQVFAEHIQPHLNKSSAALSLVDEIHRLINSYFLLMCHELAHNIEMNHNANFVNQLEAIAVRFLTGKDSFLQKFSFQNYSD